MFYVYLFIVFIAINDIEKKIIKDKNTGNFTTMRKNMNNEN